MLSKLSLCIVAASAVSIEREPLLTWAPTPPKSHPIDYFVPNFGVDVDIKATQKHIKDSEKKLDHVWTPVKLDDPHPQDYKVPDLGLDKDIIDAGESIKSSEETLGHVWTPKQDKDDMWIVPEAADNASYSYSA